MLIIEMVLLQSNLMIQTGIVTTQLLNQFINILHIVLSIF